MCTHSRAGTVVCSADVRGRALRQPTYDPEGAFASVVHGLGFLPITHMALSGTLYLIAPQEGYKARKLLHLAMEVHGSFGNLFLLY